MKPLFRVFAAVLIGIVLIVALVAGVRYAIYATAHETTDDAQVDADIVAVTSKIAERVDAVKTDTNRYVHRGEVVVVLDDRDELLRYRGAVAAYRAAHAQAEAARQDVNLTLDQVRGEVRQGNGSVDQAHAGITDSQAQVEAEEAQIRAAASSVTTSLAQLAAARAAVPAAAEAERRQLDDLHRSEALVRTGDTPRSELDAARSAEASSHSSLIEAEANVDAAEANVAAAQEKLAAQRSSTAAAEAAVSSQAGLLESAQGKLQEAASPYRVGAQQASAEAALAQVATDAAQVAEAREQLDDTVIRAPSDGYIGEKSVEAGRTVSPGETLLTIVPDRRVYITANYKETQLGKIRPGQETDISVDAYHGHAFTGHVQALGPASEGTYSLLPAQNATGNFVKVTQRLPVRIVVDTGEDAQHRLRVGMSVETSVRIKE